MRKFLSMGLALLVGLVFYSMSMASSKGPETIVLQAPKAKLGPKIVFSHKKHQDTYKIGCGECHHGMSNGKQVPYKEGQEVKKCADCHNKKAMHNPKLNSCKKAYHKNCIGCHRMEKKHGHPNAPTKCKACHTK